jgi:serine/threonine protein kinase
MPDWQVPGYTAMKRIGSGGFGEVLLARHDASGTLVAIKYLRHELLADAESAEMFRSEATVLASLDDPNIVRLYEYVESPSGAAIVMELVGGVSLREILTYQGKTAPEAALVVLQGSLLGLAAAHRRGIVHRDFKPENVLVNGDGVSKLTDFGIAARSGGFAVPAGTLRYAAPEQMAGAVSTPAGDIYAATATFYECLTGRPPFSGDADDLLSKHRTEPVPLDQVPEALRPLVAAGMAKDPGGRPTDATAFVNDLRAVASAAYGRAWQEHGRSHLSEAALLLAALWPSGAPPTVQGTSVYRVPLRKRPRLWHAGPAKVGIAAGIAVAAAVAGTALAVSGGLRTTAADRPAAAVQSVSLQPSSGQSATSGSASATRPASPRSPSPGQAPTSEPGQSPAGTGPTVPASSATRPRRSTPPPSTRPAAPPPSTQPAAPPPSTQPAAPPPSTQPAAPPPSTQPAAPPAVPEITSVGTHTQGVLVYFDIQYSNPGNNAVGFGFQGVNGSGWAEETHPFTSPSYGIVGTDSISYPFNEACGTAQQYSSYVEAWIYDSAGASSTPVVIHLVCAGSAG